MFASSLRSFPGGESFCAESTFCCSSVAMFVSFVAICAAVRPGVVSAEIVCLPLLADCVPIVLTLLM